MLDVALNKPRKNLVVVVVVVVQGAGRRVQDAGCRMQGAGFMIRKHII